MSGNGRENHVEKRGRPRSASVNPRPVECTHRSDKHPEHQKGICYACNFRIKRGLPLNKPRGRPRRDESAAAETVVVSPNGPYLVVENPGPAPAPTAAVQQPKQPTTGRRTRSKRAASAAEAAVADAQVNLPTIVIPAIPVATDNDIRLPPRKRAKIQQ